MKIVWTFRIIWLLSIGYWGYWAFRVFFEMPCRGCLEQMQIALVICLVTGGVCMIINHHFTDNGYTVKKEE